MADPGTDAAARLRVLLHDRAANARDFIIAANPSLPPHVLDRVESFLPLRETMSQEDRLRVARDQAHAAQRGQYHGGGLRTMR